MTIFGFSVEGVAALQAALKTGAMQIDMAARANVAEASAYLIREAQSNFEGAHKRGQPHVGGAQPNVVSGNLRRSILSTGIRSTALGYVATVGPTTVYGRRVELGMGGRGAYPYFGPAATVVRRQMPIIAAANWNKFVTF